MSWPPKPWPPLSDEELARLNAESAVLDAELALRSAQESAAFIGTVVKAEKCGKLVIISEWYKWR